MSHYTWLEKHLPDFFEKVGLNKDYTVGLLSCHGDKMYGYKFQWEEAGIHFYHGVAICLLSYFRPFDEESRETSNGWVAPSKWVIDNKERFLKYLPEVKENDNH